MNRRDFNDIGISRQLDWERIKKLLIIGDMRLGWGFAVSAYTA